MSYRTALALFAVATVHGMGFAAAQEAPAQARSVAVLEIDDLKAVFATVRSKDRIEARVRTPGTVASLSIDRGSAVEAARGLLALMALPCEEEPQISVPMQD